jgi:hypothetical protein
MRWEDERYVRFYTRDTPEFLALTWHARGLFGLVLRVVDRAGVLPVGKLGLKGVAVAVHAPWAEIEAPLGELLGDGCLAYDETRGAVFIRNYLAAQECPQSDRARKRASRERTAASFGGSVSASENATEALAGDHDMRQSAAVATNVHTQIVNQGLVTTRDDIKSRPVTISGHNSGPNVTSGHAASHAVTPCRAVPTHAVPTHAGEEARARDPFPLSHEVQDQCGAAGWDVSLARRDEDRLRVEKAIARVTVPVAVERLLAMVELERSANFEPRPYLGWYVETILGQGTNGKAKAPPVDLPAPEPAWLDAHPGSRERWAEFEAEVRTKATPAELAQQLEGAVWMLKNEFRDSAGGAS